MSRKSRCRCNKLMLFTMVGVVLGVVLGILVEQYDPPNTSIMWIGLPGELYVRFLKMLITPLLLTSVISGTSSMNANTSGKAGLCTVVYLVLTNLLGCMIGCVISLAFVQGASDNNMSNAIKQSPSETDYHDLFADVFRNLVPDNMFLAYFKQTQTRYLVQQNKSVAPNQTEETQTKDLHYVDGVNVLGILTISALLGICAGKVKEDGETFRTFISSAFKILMYLMRAFMWCTPLGLMSLLAKTVVTADSLVDDMANIVMYLVIVTVGQCIIVLVIVPLVYVIVRRANPLYLFLRLRKPILLSFVTGSTAVVIPDTVRTLVGEMGVDKHIAEFVVPLSTTIGRCGSSLYVSVACFFLLRTQTSDPSAETVVLICLMATLLSTASPSVAGSSMSVVILIVSNFNLPSDMVAILLSTDWIIDRVRTISNYSVQILGIFITDSFCMLSTRKVCCHQSDRRDSISIPDSSKPSTGERKASVLSTTSLIRKDSVISDVTNCMVWDMSISNELSHIPDKRRPSLVFTV
ncbi:excitatory amino acid transporter-like [Argopecten irradians]|uniref:excitatory amino acid transporter-like n=1 Tax=Argopecten irradians TaxID=31199 RepID=UPI003724009A